MPEEEQKKITDEDVNKNHIACLNSLLSQLEPLVKTTAEFLDADMVCNFEMLMLYTTLQQAKIWAGKGLETIAKTLANAEIK